jgi:hypothetical protein
LINTNLISKRYTSSITENDKPYISSKALTDINIFLQALNDIRGNKGAMTPGIDKETLDGMSKKKLEKLQQNILN